ncbi:MAG: M23 family metallopeptidase [Bradymonadaceae bacterium]
MKIILALLAIGLMGGCASFRPTTPVCMSGAYLDAHGRCQAQSAPRHHLPFRPGHEVKVMQGFHGYTSHKEDLAYSVDFGCEEGTPIVASRRGVVWDARKDSSKGCPDKSCIDEANYVILDHGDGTFSEYYHLLHKGVTVEVGEQVCAGQVIGLCGNTGFSSGPHLHFGLTDASRQTIPFQFHEGRDRRFSFVVPEATYVSENRRQLYCGRTSFSAFERDAFAHQGILLRKAIPAVIDESTRTMRIEGVYYGDHTHVAIHRKVTKGGAWVEECVPVDGKGRFRTMINWSPQSYPEGHYWFMITGSNRQCRSPGWSWSYKVLVTKGR